MSYCYDYVYLASEWLCADLILACSQFDARCHPSLSREAENYYIVYVCLVVETAVRIAMQSSVLHVAHSKALFLCTVLRSIEELLAGKYRTSMEIAR